MSGLKCGYGCFDTEALVALNRCWLSLVILPKTEPFWALELPRIYSPALLIVDVGFDGSMLS